MLKLAKKMHCSGTGHVKIKERGKSLFFLKKKEKCTES
jgi:hypothetical protein